MTALEVQLYEIPEIYAGVLFFPWERSSEVLHAWLDWTRTVPDEVTSVGRILQFPPLPELPDFLRGRKFAVVEAVFIGSETDGASCSSRCARSARRWTRSRWCLRSGSPSSTWTRPSPCRTRARG